MQMSYPCFTVLFIQQFKHQAESWAFLHIAEFFATLLQIWKYALLQLPVAAYGRTGTDYLTAIKMYVHQCSSARVIFFRASGRKSGFFHVAVHSS